MKSNPKLKIMILITLGILLALSPIFVNILNFNVGYGDKNSENGDAINLNDENLKISTISGKIHIINNSGWIDFRNDGNCTGSGAYSDPYVIEDLVIDGGGSGNCIWIENSDVYFKIENCAVYNSGEYNAGIRLSRVKNSQLINNTVNYNWAGIYLSNSNFNDISKNTANDNRDGIYLSDSDNNHISENTAYYNKWRGIYLSDSDNNSISGNTANDNIDGIYLWVSDNNTVSGNIMNECGLSLFGTFEELRSHDIDATNLVNGKPLYYYTNEVNLRPNNFTNAGQVILVNCHDSLISNLNTSHTSRGITLYYCNDNTITGNTANDNRDGIYLKYSDNNTVSGNIASYNQYYGIYLKSSDNNTISGNTASNNGIGICIYGIYSIGCDNNIITLNCFINNTINADDDGGGSNNHWDNGIKGNYWSDYTGSDADGDGIDGVPYTINGFAGSQDNFPLMKCPISTREGGGIPFELIIIISIISGGAVIGVATLLLIRHKRKRIQ